MFVLCPHCQFLVTLGPGGQPPPLCPRCDHVLTEQAAEDVVPVPVALDAASTPETDPTSDEPITGDTAAADSAPESVALAIAVAVADADTAAAQPDLVGPSTDTAIDDATDEPASKPGDAFVDTMPGGVALEVDAEVATIPTAVPVPEPASVPDAPPAVVPKAARRRVKAAPSFVSSGDAGIMPGRRRQWPYIGASAGLTLLLVVQLLLADRARLSTDARWRPALAALCALLQCTLPPWHEPTAFTLLSRDVRAHPAVPGALRVTATFRNDAHWPQPWPSLLLTLSDLDGRIAGARVFGAHEYLGATPTRSELQSGQSAAISVDVVEPAPRIVAFTFDFR